MLPLSTRVAHSDTESARLLIPVSFSYPADWCDSCITRKQRERRGTGGFRGIGRISTACGRYLSRTRLLTHP